MLQQFMNNKQQHFKEIAWLLFLASSLLGCSHQPPSSPQDAEATESGHEKMREELARIADSADRENIFTGEVIVNELRGLMSLPSYTQRLEPDRKWKFFLDLGVKELRLGNETEAIAHLTQALATVPTTSDPDKVKTLTHYHLALAYLRLAETQNCCQRNTQDSCIVPIQGSGIHQNPTGARHAIDHLKEVLSSTTKCGCRKRTTGNTRKRTLVIEYRLHDTGRVSRRGPGRISYTRGVLQVYCRFPKISQRISRTGTGHIQPLRWSRY